MSFLKYKSHKSGLLSWILSVDHKRIGIMYLVAMGSFFLVGVSLGFLIRLELFAPGKTIVEAATYNALFTVHGVVMIFLFIIPGIPAVLGNFVLPLQLGARDVAFPKLNLLSWWVYMAGAALAVTSLFIGDGPPDTGWTFYVPYSVRSTTNVTLAVFGAFVLGFSSILTGMNFITTIHRMRAPGMTWFKMPLFSWTLYATAWIQVLATPILGITVLLVIAERTLGIGLFDPSRGGDPLLYQHLFWIYSHPAVYIMILPAMGIVSEVIPTFSRKNIFGYKAIVVSSMAIAFVGYLVWGHHMFTSGISDTARLVFSLITFLVAIPSAIKVFNWVATMYKGSIDLAPPLLFTLTFIFLFLIGGLTGLVNGALSTGVHAHDTYFVVAHFHYTMFGGTVIAFMSGILYWFPKIFGRLYSVRSINISWALIFVGFNGLYFPMFVQGWMGMPRRYYDYLPRFEALMKLSTIMSWVLVAGLLMFVGTLYKGARKGKPAPPNPWGGKGLEWAIPSPPPHENFAVIPTVTVGPQEYYGPAGLTE
jgi:cytochrome c oxidase subunit I